MDFKSNIFIFGVALIFVLPLAISSPISGAGGGNHLWPEEVKDKICSNYDNFDDVSSQQECQQRCIGKIGCVGISYSHELYQYCYVCMDDNLKEIESWRRLARYNFGFYRGPKPRRPKVCLDNMFGQKGRKGCDNANEYCDMLEDRCVPFTGYKLQSDLNCPSTGRLYGDIGAYMIATRSTLKEAIDYCNSLTNCRCIDYDKKDPTYYNIHIYYDANNDVISNPQNQRYGDRQPSPSFNRDFNSWLKV